MVSITLVKEKCNISKWHIASYDNKFEYSHCTDNFISDFELPTKALLFRNANCINHLRAIVFISVLITHLNVQDLSVYHLPLVHPVLI